MQGTNGGTMSITGVDGALSAVIDKVRRIRPGEGLIGAFGISSGVITTSILALTLDPR